MKLGEALLRLRRAPEVGDHEIVYDDDGVAHYLFITWVDPKNPYNLGFMCPCMKFKGGLDGNQLEVAPIVTCLECLTKA